MQIADENEKIASRSVLHTDISTTAFFLGQQIKIYGNLK